MKQSGATSLGREYVARRTGSLIAKAFQSQEVSAPVDLLRLASAAGVKSIQFRPLPIEGGLTPVVGGFYLCINHIEFAEGVRPGDQLALELTPRQRFTLAHEIAHTFFYGLVTSEESLPHAVEGTPRSHLVEECCNYGARLMLMPTALISKELERRGHRIDVAIMDRLATRCGVSIEVCLRRLNDYVANRSLDSALLMIKEGAAGADALILAAATSPSILKYVERRPVPYDNLRAWAGSFLPERFWLGGCFEIKNRGGVTIRRMRYPSRPELLFVELQNLLIAG
jgi:uncharacterized protein DUF955